MNNIRKEKSFRNIDLLSIKEYKFPITAITSILHRITGILMILLLPFILWCFQTSLSCEEYFYYIKILLTKSYLVILSWFILSIFSYHVLAGLRHLIMDFGFGDTMLFAKISSVILLLVSIIFSILWGIWLCL